MQKWEIDTIYNVDFREAIGEIMQQHKVAIIATDPPYNINFKYNKYKDNLPDTEYINLLSNLGGVSFSSNPVSGGNNEVFSTGFGRSL